MKTKLTLIGLGIGAILIGLANMGNGGAGEELTSLAGLAGIGLIIAGFAWKKA